MSGENLKKLLGEIAAGRLSVGEGMEQLRSLPYEDIGFAIMDHHRAVRCGQPEVIFCPGKTASQVVEIAQRLSVRGQTVLATRANHEQLAAVRQEFNAAEINERAGAVVIGPPATPERDANAVLVVTAGTADEPVGEEAMMTLKAMGVPAHRIVDVGVAGLHRLLGRLADLQRACAIVVVAGMEGALPSVVGGLVSCPVLAVPTSVGYGTSFGGVTALLGMLNSCASNVSVVNIDNGFGAAMSAGLIWKQMSSARQASELATGRNGN